MTPVQVTGIHHVRVPVSNLERSVGFWTATFGFERDFDFPGEAGLIATALRHPAADAHVVLWKDAERAKSNAGFTSLGLGLPDRASIDALVAALDDAGIAHQGIQPSSVEAKLVGVADPDGNLVNFYVKPQR
ncbi:MAG: VOC family protein [Microbacterium sp.]